MHFCLVVAHKSDQRAAQLTARTRNLFGISKCFVTPDGLCEDGCGLRSFTRFEVSPAESALQGETISRAQPVAVNRAELLHCLRGRSLRDQLESAHHRDVAFAPLPLLLLVLEEIGGRLPQPSREELERGHGGAGFSPPPGPAGRPRGKGGG